MLYVINNGCCCFFKNVYIENKDFYKNNREIFKI